MNSVIISLATMLVCMKTVNSEKLKLIYAGLICAFPPKQGIFYELKMMARYMQKTKYGLGDRIR